MTRLLAARASGAPARYPDGHSLAPAAAWPAGTGGPDQAGSSSSGGREVIAGQGDLHGQVIGDAAGAAAAARRPRLTSPGLPPAARRTFASSLATTRSQHSNDLGNRRQRVARPPRRSPAWPAAGSVIPPKPPAARDRQVGRPGSPSGPSPRRTYRPAGRIRTRTSFLASSFLDGTGQAAGDVAVDWRSWPPGGYQ